MLNFVTDRTQEHVRLLKQLKKKPWGQMTASEQTLWYGEAAKGAYNYTDLNRVESAVAEISVMLGLTLTTKTDWTLWDIPIKDETDRYLANVVDIRDACPGDLEFPPIPDSMNQLTFEYANNIEKVLQMAYEYINSTEVNK